MKEYHKKSLKISRRKFLEENRKESLRKLQEGRIPEGVPEEISHPSFCIALAAARWRIRFESQMTLMLKEGYWNPEELLN